MARPSADRRSVGEPEHRSGTPVACIVAIVSLAAGIGATTATLTLRKAIFFLTVGTLATWIPRRRAMSVDPARLLRTE